MSIGQAIRAYDSSCFGSGSVRDTTTNGGDGGRYRGSDCCLICLPTSGSGGGGGADEGALVVFVLVAALAAAASAAVFAYFAADSYQSAAKMGDLRREAFDNDVDVNIKQDITKNMKKVFRYLETERALTGTAYLSAAAGLSLLIAVCVFVLMKKPQHEYLKLAIAGGAVTGAFIPFFGLSFLMNPKEAIERLREHQNKRNLEDLERRKLPQSSALPADQPPPYSRFPTS